MFYNYLLNSLSLYLNMYYNKELFRLCLNGFIHTRKVLLLQFYNLVYKINKESSYCVFQYLFYNIEKKMKCLISLGLSIKRKINYKEKYSESIMNKDIIQTFQIDIIITGPKVTSYYIIFIIYNGYKRTTTYWFLCSKCFLSALMYHLIIDETLSYALLHTLVVPIMSVKVFP